jgi:hypothetical protein
MSTTESWQDDAAGSPAHAGRGITRRGFGLGALGALAAVGSIGGMQAAAATPGGPRPQLLTPGSWDVQADTWVATDGLGRALPTAATVGAPRSGRFVGIFYLTWLGQHTTTGPWDITQILAAHPGAINDRNDPAWGPLKHFHHWGQPQFGYYVSDDAWVIRKHAQMLADADIDAIFIDTTNQHLYQKPYHTILDTFAAVRADGGATPQVAFLTPFADPKQVVIDLYYDLYRPGTHSDLYFTWDGKPLILADPGAIGATDLVGLGSSASILPAGHTQGQSFTTSGAFVAVGCRIPTAFTTTSGSTLTLRHGGPTGTVIAQQAFSNIADNSLVMMSLPSQQPAGSYYLEQSAVVGTVGWWSETSDVLAGGTAYYDGVAVGGDRSLSVEYVTIERATVVDVAASRQPADLAANGTLGQTFTTGYSFSSIGCQIGTWYTTTSGVTMKLYASGPGGTLIAQHVFTNIVDNSIVMMSLPSTAAAGSYYLELSGLVGQIAWWSGAIDCYPNGQAYENGNAVVGDRSVYARPAEGTMQDIRDFFTFRKPEPSYFVGPSGPNQWGWLEDHPQHAFYDAGGQTEEVTVGIAQNIVDGRLGAMSEPHAQGRSFHNETLPTGTSQTALGLNVQEQWDRAIALDPEIIFITGWNEWVAQRFDPDTKPIPAAQGEVIFYDQFDWEHSRDIEPMIDGHGDAYYYQMIANIRRFKGVRDIPVASAATTIAIDGSFSDWASVGPEFRDHVGETAHRNHPGWGSAGTYVNTSGRNDIRLTKVARDASNVYFYVQTSDPITAHTDPRWMMLFINVDGDTTTGWEGYDFVVNRVVTSATQTVLERSTGGWNWSSVGSIDYRVSGNELELAIPRSLLGLRTDPVTFDFKWIDNMQRVGNILDTIDNGDAAPSGRFRYRYRTS